MQRAGSARPRQRPPRARGHRSRLWATLCTMTDYSQFCTVARGAEVLGERWTPLVVRELLCGSTRFNDLRRVVPRMSATLLTQRLRKLAETGSISYFVTPDPANDDGGSSWRTAPPTCAVMILETS